MVPDKIYIPIIEEDGKRLLCTNWWETDTSSRNAYINETIPYIRKDVLLKWAEKELERLYELIPDAHKVEDETATSIEVRYLGQYMQMESVINKLNEM